MGGTFIFENLRRMLTQTLSFGRADAVDVSMMGSNLAAAGYDAMLALAPILVVVVVAGIAANVMISG